MWQSTVTSRWLDTSFTSSSSLAQRSTPMPQPAPLHPPPLPPPPSPITGPRRGTVSRSATLRNVREPSASLTTMGLSGRSNSEAEILRVGVPGAGLGAVTGDGQQLSKRLRVGGRTVEAEERARSVEGWWARCCEGFSLEVDGWREWMRSANQAFTISLSNQRGHLSDAESYRDSTARDDNAA